MYDVGDDDLMGADYDLLGARGRYSIARRRTPGGLIKARPPLISRTPGVQAAPASMGVPLGFPVQTFLAATATSLNAVASPQKPVRPRSLIINVTRAGAAAIVVTVTDIRVGVRSMLGGVNALPVEAFGPTATALGFLGILFEAAQPGLDVTITFAVSAAPAGADSIACAAMMLCDSL